MRTAHLAGIDLDLLHAFHVVMTERSVSRAAEQLGMTQSGVSHALARMREAFRDDLLVRSGAQMLPTSRGLELHEAVKDVLDVLVQRVLPVARFEPAQARREFRTAMSDMAEVVSLPTLVSTLQRVAPGCRLHNVRLPNRALTDALVSGEVELAIGNVFEPTTNLYQQTMYRHPYAVLACASHPRLGRTLSTQQYVDEAHVQAATGSDDFLESEGLVPLGIQRRVALIVGGIMSLPWIVPNTALLATVPAHLSKMVKDVLPLRTYPLPFEVPDFAVKTYWHPRSHSDAGHRWFRELAFEVLHTYPSWSDAA